ncbi:BHLH domain-containing protein [Mycena chlorophos]|uniref:BHLH domain-containing protein n=1 Tax=Mycena chlorophos TaxID=658473 RepID=A0A8H6TKK8_MYCCL|nr:BHLH domain-containing protein [Mycena chlorophos]
MRRLKARARILCSALYVWIMPNSPSVLIAGAGPSGLVLALILAKNGISVRIIDKEQSFRAGSRGSGIQPRTLELYAQLGVYDSVRALGEYVPEVHMYKPGDPEPFKKIPLAEYIEPTPGIPYPNSVLVPQYQHEAALRDHLAQFGVSVELGTELRSFENTTPDSVIATMVKHQDDGSEQVETTSFEWVVGADGARSVVRKGLGLSFLGESQEDMGMAVADIEVHGLDPKSWHRWAAAPRHFILRAQHSSSNIFTLVYVCPPDEIPSSGFTKDDFILAFYEITQRRDITFGEMTWSSRYRPNIRMVDRMHVGRVFVVGDAAHCHSPAGGQGLNSSVQDSANLGWKLALVQKGLAAPKLLETYGEERLRVIAQMLSLTTELYKTVVGTFKARYPSVRQQLGTDAAEEEAASVEKMAAVRKGGEMSMLGVNYRGSSIVSETITVASGSAANSNPPAPASAYDKPDVLALGAKPAYRAPDAPGLHTATGDATRLFRIFTVTRHTVLLFAPPDADADVKGILAFLRTLPAGAVLSVRILPAGSPCPPPSQTADSEFALTLEDAGGHAYKEYGFAAPHDAHLAPAAVVAAHTPETFWRPHMASPSSASSSSSGASSPPPAPRRRTLPALSPISDLEIDDEFTGSLRRRPTNTRSASSASPDASDDRDIDPEVDELDPSHLPAPENVAARKASHNAIERARRDKLNARIIQLGSLLPSLSSVRRPSRLAITKSSIAHVHLARRHRLLAMTQLGRMAGEHAAMVDEVNRWRSRAGIPLLPRGDPERGLRAMQALDEALMEPVGTMNEDEFDERFSEAAFESEPPYPQPPAQTAGARARKSKASPQRFAYHLPPVGSFDFPYPSPAPFKLEPLSLPAADGWW